MSVYLLIHDDRMYDMGDSYVRGVYRERATAEAAIVTRTASGAPSKAWAAHNESCCGVQEFDLLDTPETDVREDDPPFDATAGGVIPQGVLDAMAAQAAKPMPFRTGLR